MCLLIRRGQIGDEYLGFLVCELGAFADHAIDHGLPAGSIFFGRGDAIEVVHLVQRSSISAIPPTVGP